MNEDKATLPLEGAYPFGAEHGLEREVNEIRDMEIEWPLPSSVRRGYMIELFEKHNVFDEFKVKYWPYGNTAKGETKRRRYLQIKKQYEDFLAGLGSEPESGPNGESTGQDDDQQFAAESDLRDFLSQNLGRIEQGLRLYQVGDRSGVEFPVNGGYIDILAVDRDQRYVVIELKVGRGRNKAIGQLLYYMGWVDKNLGSSPCRGMIIAKEIPDDLVLAVQRVPGISLYRYILSVSVELISSKP